MSYQGGENIEGKHYGYGYKLCMQTFEKKRIHSLLCGGQQSSGSEVLLCGSQSNFTDSYSLLLGVQSNSVIHPKSVN